MQPQSRFLKRLFRWRIFPIIGLIILGFFSWGAVEELIRSRQINEEIRLLEEEAEKLGQKNLEIMEFIQHATTTEFLEKEARLKFGLQKPGESVVVIPEEGKVTAEETTGSIKEWQRSNPYKWWVYFFGQ